MTDKLTAADVLRIVAEALRDEAARREAWETKARDYALAASTARCRSTN